MREGREIKRISSPLQRQVTDIVLRTTTHTHRFKHSIVTAKIGTGHQARPSHQASTHVAHHVPVQIGHHHYIKLLWFGHQLKYTHRVNNLGAYCIFVNA